MTQPTEPQVQFPKLPVSAVNVILSGLGELPARVSGELLVWLKTEAEKQIADQQRAAEAARDEKA